jgi:hypothetical protein
VPQASGHDGDVQHDERRSPEAFVFEVLGESADDLTGVYEVLWLANTWYPEWLMSERLQVAEQAIARLVSEGLVTLCRGEWEDAADHPVPVAETDAVLRDWATWAIPEGPHVFIFATDEGRAKITPS